MKSSDNRIFNLFIGIYILIAILFVGSMLFNSMTAGGQSESTVPVLSQTNLDSISQRLEQREILTATDSASITNIEFGKIEPFR